MRWIGEYSQGLDQSCGGLGNILRASTSHAVDWGIFSGPGPVMRWIGEYSQGLDQSGGGLGNILRAWTSQAVDWGIFSGPGPVKRWIGEYTCGRGASPFWSRLRFSFRSFRASDFACGRFDQ
jgi:hypothetical protein